MRTQQYIHFLSKQMNLIDIKNTLGADRYERLRNHFGGAKDLAVWQVNEDEGKEALEKAMSSRFVCKAGNTYDIIVYTKDGTDCYRRGNYFTNAGKSYLAFGGGSLDIENYVLESMPTLIDTIVEESGLRDLSW